MTDDRMVWEYRPDPYDDWGVVRTAPDGQGRRWIVCQARLPYADDASMAVHRANGTDPYEATARLIAAAPELVSILQALIIDLCMDGNLEAYSEKHTLIAKAEALIKRATHPTPTTETADV